jgi:hypothetical protein
MAQPPTLVPPALDRCLRRDLRTLVCFVAMYCRKHHHGAALAELNLRGIDVALWRSRGIWGRRPIRLCPACAKLLGHALVKRLHCPMNPKPACKHCPNHCYHPTYRQEMRRVMRYSGRALILRGRLDYLWHLLF